jgi:hypothetical protein
MALTCLWGRLFPNILLLSVLTATLNNNNVFLINLRRFLVQSFLFASLIIQYMPSGCSSSSTEAW